MRSRWHRSPRYGWVWWPQYQWAPAWVDWRCNSAGNVSWAPMAPPGFAVSFASSSPHWSFAYGRHHRPHMSSFSWGRYGGWNGGWNRGWRHGGYGYGGGGYRGGGHHHGGGHYRGGGWGGGGYHRAAPVYGGGGGGNRHRGRGRGRW